MTLQKLNNNRKRENLEYLDGGLIHTLFMHNPSFDRAGSSTFWAHEWDPTSEPSSVLFSFPISTHPWIDHRVLHSSWMGDIARQTYRPSANMNPMRDETSFFWIGGHQPLRQKPKHSWLFRMTCKFLQYFLLFFVGIAIAYLISVILGVAALLTPMFIAFVGLWWLRISFCLFLILGLAVIFESISMK